MNQSKYKTSLTGMRMLSPSTKLLSVCLLFLSGYAFAQEDSTQAGTIETERLIIVKPYSPTVSDAVKLKQLPQRQADSSILKKKNVDYTIFHIPVASTFTPDKGQAVEVERQYQPETYDNYAALGIGNYTNIFAEFYSNIEVNSRHNLKIGFQHHSSQGGIEDALLDDTYYDTRLGLDYVAEAESFFWGAQVGIHHQAYNWYGIFDNSFSAAERDKIDAAHNYTAINVGGDLTMKQGAFKGLKLRYRHFGDNFDSQENKVSLKPSFSFAIGEEEAIDVDVSADYYQGSFGQITDKLWDNYSYLNLGITPSIVLQYHKFALDLGVEAVYAMDLEHEDNEFMFFPDVKASYRVAGEYFILYAGVNGGLEQNTYYDFTQKNHFVSPDLQIAPTKNTYNIFVGGQGKFTDKLHYDIRGSYLKQENNALFAMNVLSYAMITPAAGYTYNNSFGVVYDDMETLSIYGALSFDVTDDLVLGLNATYSSYSMDTESEAWNLPELEAAFNVDYDISERWIVGADLYYVGQRYDRLMGGIISTQKVQLDGYVDANLQVDFKVNDQLGLFLRGNNLFGNNYKRWYHYPVQGIQGMLGASYQF